METEMKGSVHEVLEAVLLALAAAAAAAFFRSVLWAWGEGLFEQGPSLDLIQSLARVSCLGLPLALVFFAVLTMASVVLVRRKARMVSISFASALYGFLVWTFISLRMPGELFGSSPFVEAPGVQADIAAILASLWLTNVVLLSRFPVPMIHRQARALKIVGLTLLAATLGLFLVGL